MQNIKQNLILIHQILSNAIDLDHMKCYKLSANLKNTVKKWR